MSNWLTNIYKAFIYVSAILFIIALNTSGSTTINASIAGYSTMSISLLLIMIVIINGINQTIQDGASFFQTFLNIIKTLGPFLLVFAIIGFMMYLLIKFKTIITEGHVSNYYNTFSFLSSILVLVQIYLLYDGINSLNFQRTHTLSKVIISVVCLVAVLNTISALILYVILNYYTTDGYKNLL
jgi:hypothetical protein